MRESIIGALSGGQRTSFSEAPAKGSKAEHASLDTDAATAAADGAASEAPVSETDGVNKEPYAADGAASEAPVSETDGVMNKESYDGDMSRQSIAVTDEPGEESYEDLMADEPPAEEEDNGVLGGVTAEAEKGDAEGDIPVASEPSSAVVEDRKVAEDASERVAPPDSVVEAGEQEMQEGDENGEERPDASEAVAAGTEEES